MTAKLHKPLHAALLAAALTGLAIPAGAASLGRIQVQSPLGQPLRAEIEVDASPDELPQLSAKIAGPEHFASARLDYSPLMRDLRVSVERRGGKAVLRLASDQPATEPFVGVLVELSWGAGRQIRDYNFLLDSPANARPAADVVPTLDSPSPAASEPAADSAAGERPVPVARADNPASRPAAVRSYRVRSGDTLAGIAREYQPAGVSLEQMLVALYRANPAAFEGRNMNRLLAGRILRIPDDPSAVGGRDAQREVLAQARDFASYRDKLAAQARQMPRDDSAARSDSGRITPKVEDRAAAEDGRDQVRVSRGDGGNGDAKAAARVRALEEDLVARDKALKEAQGRVDELERNVRDLQKLLELKNQNLADLQKQAEAAKAEPPPPPKAAEPEPPARVDESKPAESEAKTDDKPEDKPAAEESPPAAPPEADKAPAPQPEAHDDEEQPPPGFLDRLLARPLPLAVGGSGLVVMLASLLWYRAYQRRQQQRQTEDEAQFESLPPLPEVEPPEPVMATPAPSVSPSPEPVPDADDGMTLLEVGGSLDDLPPEEPLYTPQGRLTEPPQPPMPEPEPLFPSEEPAPLIDDFDLPVEPTQTPDADPFAFDEPFATEPAVTEPILTEPALDFDFALDEPVGNTLLPEEPADEDLLSDADLLGGLDADFGADSMDDLATEAPDLDFNLDLPAGPGLDSPEETVEPLDDVDIMDVGDAGALEMGQFPEAPMDGADEDLSEPPMVDLDTLDLEAGTDVPEPEIMLEEPAALGDEMLEPEDTLEPDDLEPEYDPEVVAEVATKLELARAYEEMGDREGARELIEEVVGQGRPEQQSEAAAMLARLA